MANNIDEGSVSWNLTVKTDDAEKKIDKLSGSVQNLHKLFGLFKVSVFVKGLQSISTTIGKMTEKQMQYIQTQNIFNKTMGEFTKTATEFRDNMESRLGMDPQQIMDSMSAFRRLTETFGIASDRADLMSTNLTQLASDMTAYGYSFDNAMQKLKSGISGEIEPMRAMGVALDKATLQQTLYEAGINRTYDSLTRAQKTELLYYQIMTQTTKMQGELARTMASPANMARIMKQEFTQLGRAIGSIFIPLAMKVIPVIRAITQELIRLARWLAGKAGFDIEDYTTDYTAGFEDIAGGINDVEESADGAAKALNKMLMPFDELNNINTSSASGAGGVGGAGGGGSLFEDLPSYDIFEGLSDSMNKNVEKIKAKIEELLPVIKAVGIALGTAFALTKLADFFDWLTRIDVALGTLGKLGGLVEIGLGALLTIGGIWTQWQGTRKLLNGDYSIWAVLETIGGTALGTLGIVSILKGIQKMGGLTTLSTGNMIGFGISAMLMIQAFQVILDGIKNQDILKMVVGTLEGVLSVVGMAASLGAGAKTLKMTAITAIFAITAFELLIDSIQSGNFLERVLGSFSSGAVAFKLSGGNLVVASITTVVSFAITSVIGENLEEITDWWDEAFGDSDEDTVGSFGELIFGKDAYENALNNLSATIAFNGEMTKLQSIMAESAGILDRHAESTKNLKTYIDELKESYENTEKTLLKNKEATLSSIDVTSGYIDELEGLIDSEGKVKLGSEKRAEVILGELNKALGTEYTLDGNLITRNGEVIESYTDLQNEIHKTIEEKKKEIEQEVYLDLYTNALNTKITAQKQYTDALAEQKNLQAKLLEAQNNNDREAITKLTQDLYEAGLKVQEFGELNVESAQDTAYYSLLAFNQVSDDMLDMSDINSQALYSLLVNNEEKWNELYNNLNDTQKETMAAMTASVEQTIKDTEKQISTNDIPKNSKEIARLARNRFSNEFDINSVVKLKVQDGANTISNNAYLFGNSGSTLVNQFISSINNADTKTPGKNIVYGIASGIQIAQSGQTFQGTLSGFVTGMVAKMNQLLDSHSPSRLMRDKVGKFIPLGIAAGIDMEADSVSDSMERIAERVRVDQQDFDFYSSRDLVSDINGKINAQTVAAFNNDTLQDMANATYEAMSRALIENNDDLNPYFNVYVGNDKVYSGYGKQQDRESNMYGIKV